MIKTKTKQYSCMANTIFIFITRLHIFECKYGPKRVQRWERIALVRNQINWFISLRDQFSQAKFTNASFFCSILRAARMFALLRLSCNKQFITRKVVQCGCIFTRQFNFSRLKQARKNKTNS